MENVFSHISGPEGLLFESHAQCCLSVAVLLSSIADVLLFCSSQLDYGSQRCVRFCFISKSLAPQTILHTCITGHGYLHQIDQLLFPEPFF